MTIRIIAMNATSVQTAPEISATTAICAYTAPLTTECIVLTARPATTRKAIPASVTATAAVNVPMTGAKTAKCALNAPLKPETIAPTAEHARRKRAALSAIAAVNVPSCASYAAIIAMTVYLRAKVVVRVKTVQLFAITAAASEPNAARYDPTAAFARSVARATAETPDATTTSA